MPKKDKQYHHGDLAETLISTTVQLLQEKGAGNLSLREVARIAGVSHGAPAHHFTDKTGLLTAVAIQGQERLAEKLEQSQVGIKNPIERLITAGEAYVRFALSHPGHFDVMFQKEMITAEDPDFKLASAKARQVLETAIRDLALLQAKNNQPSAHRIEATLAALWSQVHGFSLLWQSGNFGNPDDQEHLTKLLREVLTGIAPRLDS